jgi:hypothetical protein
VLNGYNGLIAKLKAMQENYRHLFNTAGYEGIVLWEQLDKDLTDYDAYADTVHGWVAYSTSTYDTVKRSIPDSVIRDAAFADGLTA